MRRWLKVDFDDFVIADAADLRRAQLAAKANEAKAAVCEPENSESLIPGLACAGPQLHDRIRVFFSRAVTRTSGGHRIIGERIADIAAVVEGEAITRGAGELTG